MLQVQDLPLLVFVREDDTTKIQVGNTFDFIFSVTANLNCGAVPLTRALLLLDHVQHQVVVKEHGTIDLETDPKVQVLIRLQ